MQGKVTFNDAAFNRQLSRYMSQTTRDIAGALNSRAAYLIYKAANWTKVADKKQMGKWVRSKDGQNWIGSLFGEKKLMGYVRGSSMPADRKEATKRIIKARNASMAFIKAGWIRPLGAMAKKGGVKLKVKGAKQVKGKKLGVAFPARNGWKAAAYFENLTGAGKGSDKKRRGQKNSASKAAKIYGGEALKRAFTSEKASIQKHLLKKFKKTAAKHAGP